MSIQDRLDNQTQDQLMPRGVIVLNNETGSFDLKKGWRLTLRNCSDVTCNSNEGMNELSLIECSNVTITDFQNGVLRFWDCDQVQQVTTTSTKVIISGAQVEQLDMTSSEVTLVKCQPQQAQFSGCKLVSFQNEWQQCTVEGGSTWSEQDQFQGDLEINGNAVATLVSPQVQGDATFDKSHITLSNAQFQGQPTITDSQIEDLNGQYQEATMSGENLAVTLISSQFQTLTFSDGQINLNEVQIQEQFTATDALVNAQNIQVQESVELENCSAVLVNCTIQESLTLTSSGVKMTDSTIQESLTVNDGSLESVANTVQESFSMSGGTLESAGDTFNQDVSLDSLVGPSMIRNLQGAQTVTITGNGTSTLVLDSVQAQTMSVSDFSDVRIVDTTADTFTADSIDSLLLSNDTLDTATISDCNNVIAATSTIQDLTLTSCNQAVTANVAFMTADSSVISDNGSTMDEAVGCIVNAIGSNITCFNCIINALGGTVTATGKSLVNGVSVVATNSDGLTVGTDFDATTQAGCILYDGNLTAQASIGNANLNSLLEDVSINADVGSILATATTDISATAMGDISLEATVDVSINGEGITLDGTAITETAATITLDGTVEVIT